MRRTVEELLEVRDRLHDLTDIVAYHAAHLLQHLIARGDYVSGDMLPTDMRLLLPVVREQHESPISAGDLVKIRAWTRRNPALLSPHGEGPCVLDRDMILHIFGSVQQEDLAPQHTPEEVADQFLATGGWGQFHPGQPFTLTTDWIEALVTAWRVTQYEWRRDESPEAAASQALTWLCRKNEPTEPAPLTIDRLFRCMGAEVMQRIHEHDDDLGTRLREGKQDADDRQILRDSSALTGDRLFAHIRLGDDEGAMSLLDQVERDRGPFFILLKIRMECQLRQKQYTAALESGARCRAAISETPHRSENDDSRRVEVAELEARALMHMGHLGEATQRATEILVIIEETRTIGDMGYCLFSSFIRPAGSVTNEHVQHLTEIGRWYEKAVEILLQLANAPGESKDLKELEEVSARALRLGKRILRVFPNGELDRSVLEAVGAEHCLRDTQGGV